MPTSTIHCSVNSRNPQLFHASRSSAKRIDEMKFKFRIRYFFYSTRLILRCVLVLSSAILLRDKCICTHLLDRVVSNSLPLAATSHEHPHKHLATRFFCPFISQHSAPSIVRVSRFFTALDASRPWGKAAPCFGGNQSAMSNSFCVKN